MPRTKLPPTPATSTGPSALENLDMENYTLPPAMNSPPLSPVIHRKRTLSGSDLPPPPSRARKIIQMKPEPVKPTSSTSTSPKRKQPSATSAAGRKIARKTAHSIIERRRRSKMNEEFGVLKDMIPACNGVDMHKLAILQAGIEYVRYLQGCVEKLQEGQHSSVRLQSSRIEVFEPRKAVDEDSEMEEEDDEESDEQKSPAIMPQSYVQPQPQSQGHTQVQSQSQTHISSQSQSQGQLPAGSGSGSQIQTRYSPVIAAQAQSQSRRISAIAPASSGASSSLTTQQSTLLPVVSSPQNDQQPLRKTYSTSPPPLQTGISPAFNAIQFSPEINRHAGAQTWKQSPNILPLPQAAMAMPLPGMQLGSVGSNEEATATAALMMLTNDRRSGRGGMSVRDLLSH